MEGNIKMRKIGRNWREKCSWENLSFIFVISTKEGINSTDSLAQPAGANPIKVKSSFLHHSTVSFKPLEKYTDGSPSVPVLI